VVTAEDILYIQELIAAHPRASRRRLSQKLCEAWQWRQANRIQFESRGRSESIPEAVKRRDKGGTAAEIEREQVGLRLVGGRQIPAIYGFRSENKN
jgi:hypothetical protein